MDDQDMSLGKSLFAARNSLAFAIAVVLAACQTTAVTTPKVQPTDAGSDAVKQANVGF